LCRRRCAVQRRSDLRRGELVALTNPENGKIVRLVHDAEALSGTLRIEGEDDALVVWTRASSTRARLVGHALRSTGDLYAITLASPEGPIATRTFGLYDTATETLRHGTCRAAQ
jgi:hypothetical protein